MSRSLFALIFAVITCSAHATGTAKVSAHAAPMGDAARGKEIATTVCAACHGADGNSLIPVNPTLAGQSYDYLLKQMTNFKAADGQPALRANAVMGGMIAPYDLGQMRDLAAYFATQTAKPGAAKNEATIKLGQTIYRRGDASKGLPACASCHGPTGAGIPAQYPRVGGQHADYAEVQLKAFRDGTRANDPAKIMRTIALKMTDAEIKAVTDYMAGLH
ncbi:cytochrome C [Rugosibacter aromaticivorans]|uniref:Cytochrome C n=1 Tax=Rugosibacter aromaticivorans TaxID=1565605 RepID=A0A0C5J6V0_9PROT|nr:c-type cytochrome [Rugosibacter aromaticivorans]AJP47379.1 cytochrome C [Rugosibacter aromaticivorans]TBR13893.1 MAG: cytochrome c4 [Rugosibacter sp.]